MISLYVFVIIESSMFSFLFYYERSHLAKVFLTSSPCKYMCLPIDVVFDILMLFSKIDVVSDIFLFFVN